MPGCQAKARYYLSTKEMPDALVGKLTDPISKYLPDGTTVPQRGGQGMTLQDLAMHTSGLPRMPNNCAPPIR